MVNWKRPSIFILPGKMNIPFHFRNWKFITFFVTFTFILFDSRICGFFAFQCNFFKIKLIFELSD